MHGLIFETSICYWQDQPDNFHPQRHGVGRSQATVPSCAVRFVRAGFPGASPTDKLPIPIVDSVKTLCSRCTHGQMRPTHLPYTALEYLHPALCPGALLNCWAVWSLASAYNTAHTSLPHRTATQLKIDNSVVHKNLGLWNDVNQPKHANILFSNLLYLFINIFWKY